jgi:integrase
MAISKRRGKWVADFRDQFTRRRWITCETRREAAQRLHEARNAIAKNEYQAPSEAMNFEQVTEAYLYNIRPEVRQSTHKDYESIIRLHLNPYFERRKVMAITLTEIEKFRASMLGKEVKLGKKMRKIGIRQTNKALTQLVMVLNYARRHGWVTRNVAEDCKKVSADEHNVTEQDLLSPEEIVQLLTHANEFWRPLLATAVFTGLRQGELLGLTWSDIELDARKLYVRRQFTSGRMTDVKTKAGRRTVSIPASLAAELRRWRLACPASELDLVFPSKAGTPISPQNMLSRGFLPALRRAKLRRLKFHSLRHSYASMLLHNNEPIKRVQTLLGHASAQVTLDVYGHLLPDREDGAASRLDQLVGWDGSKTVAARNLRQLNDTQAVEFNGGPAGTRTQDQRIMSPLL